MSGSRAPPQTGHHRLSLSSASATWSSTANGPCWGGGAGLLPAHDWRLS